MSKTENTHKMTIRLSPITEFRLERDYRLDGSRSKNEFIERAITHYQDLLDCIQIDADYLRKLRSDSVRNVKVTNGLLTFEQKVKELENSVEGDDQWQN